MQLAKVIEGSGGKCEDRLGVFDGLEGLVLAVADGAGGMSGGAEAAELAINMTRQDASLLASPDACCNLLYKIDTELSKQLSGGQTTCVIVVVSPTEIYGASIGDSVAWVVGGEAITNLTEYQVRKPLVGSGTVHPTSFKRARPQTKLLLASDGLVKYTSAERIRSCVVQTDIQNAAHGLVELVRYSSGALPDDVAIILADLKL